MSTLEISIAKNRTRKYFTDIVTAEIKQAIKENREPEYISALIDIRNRIVNTNLSDVK